MSFARKIRRQQGTRAASFQQLAKAVEAFDKVGAMDGLQEITRLVQESHALVGRLMEDHQTLSHELAVQRQVNVRLLAQLGECPVEDIRQAEEMVREQVLSVEVMSVEEIRARLAGNEGT